MGFGMTNAEFDLAEQFALYTHKHCFITGKAGTGKTTLLKRIAERTQKNVVVVAPTGVAAINAGGVTIHSMFGLPLTCFVPGNDFADPNLATNRPRLRHEHMHYRKEKLRLFRELDSLVIDEVSMVRCDLLDAIDFVLRTVRRNDKPFGAVQVLLIGDMHQLPPVIKDPEWNILKAYYQSPYFFDSRVWPQLNAAKIELQTTYRQSDARFLALLSHIRHRRMDDGDYAQLRGRYNPNFEATGKGYVLLSTHNLKADAVNTSELEKIPGPMQSFEAKIEGDFPENLFPCDRMLHLKTGAQVMFIRNDTEGGRYYNGKLAAVKRMDRESITVTFNDDGQDYDLHREIWENTDYSVDAESGTVVKKELGSFSQFPLRLAWAITIHKSQGLTFDKVIIDAGRSFAPGQVYVALSRCRSLGGIVLHSLIPPSALHSDERIGEFSAAHHSPGGLQDVLETEKILFANHSLLRLFTFSGLSEHLQEWQELITKKEIPDKDAAIALQERISAQAAELNATAARFRRQLERIFAAIDSDPSQTATLKERSAKAIRYFTDQIAAQLITPLRGHINGIAYKKKVKRYVRHVQLIEETCWNKIERLYDGRFLDEKLYDGEVTHTRDSLQQVVSSATSGKKEKGGTFKDTLNLHRKGKTAEEIAEIRGLTVGTIKNHYARWIASGEINIYEVLPAEMIDLVVDFVEQGKGQTVGVIRSELGDQYDYNDIRMILSHIVRKHTINRNSADLQS
jgi:ATP-dependent DNA helicase PIF1